MAVIGATQIQPVNFLEEYAKGLQVGAGRRQLERQEIDRIKAAEQQRALNELYSRALGPTGQVDVNQLYRNLATQGMGGMIPGLQAQAAETAQKSAAAGKSMAEADKIFWETSRNELASIPDNNQAAYQAWANRIVERAPWTAKMLPPILTPQTKQQLLMTADAALPKGEVQDIRGGTAVINPYTGQQIGTTIKDVYDPITIARAGAPKTSITNVQEKAEAGEYGKFLQKSYEEIRDRANRGRRFLPNLELASKTLERGLETGFGAEFKKDAQRVLVGLGLNTDEAKANVENAELFQTVVKNQVLQRLADQKGPQTDQDALRAEQTIAGFDKSTDVNKFLIAFDKAVTKQDLAQEKFYRDWRVKNKTFDGAEDAWLSGPGNKSVFDDPTLKKFVGGESNVPPPPPGMQINTNR
jgi:hypothetical protein